MDIQRVGQIFAALMLACLTACTDNAVRISIYQGKIEANEGYRKAIAAYEKTHPGVRISIEAGVDYNTSLKAKMNSEPPTVFSVSSYQDLEDYSAVLEDVSDLPIMAHVLPGATEIFERDGKVYAVPLYMEGYGFVINREIFESIGVSFDSMLSFEGMQAGFDRLKSAIERGELSESYPLLEAVMEYPTKELWIAGDHDANVALAHDFTGPGEANESATLPGTGFADYKKMVDFQASYTTNAQTRANLNSVDYTSSLEGGIAIERVAAIKQGNWIAPAVAFSDPEVLEKLDMLPYSLPGFSEGKYFAGVSGYWAIHSAASPEQKEAARDFINWLYSDPEGQRIFIEDCQLIPPFDNFGDLTVNDPLSRRLMQAIQEENTLNGWVYNGAPATWGQQSAGVQVQRYLAGQASWDEAMQTCIAQWASMRATQRRN